MEISYDPYDCEDPDETGYAPRLWERPFFNAFLMKYGTITGAAEATGITKKMVEERMREEPIFVERLHECEEYLKDMVRQEIFRRAIEPVEVPIYQRGILVGKKLEWDNRHLEWVAERLLPNEFHLPSRVEFQGDSDGAMEFKLEIAPNKDEKKKE